MKSEDNSSSRVVEELKRETLRLLDADKDGKLTLEDAKAIAMSMQESVSSAAEEALRAWMDDDYDLGGRLQSVYAAVRPYKHSLLMTGGFVACFYGSNFKYSILFFSTAAPTLTPAVDELARSYRRHQKEHLLKAVDPLKVWDVLKAAYVGIAAAFAGILSDSAARLGLGVSVGDKLADAVNSVFAPIISRFLHKRLAPKIQTALADNDVLDLDQETIRRWIDAVIRAASTAVGLYVAHRVDDMIYLYSACLTGAALAVDHATIIFFGERPHSAATTGGSSKTKTNNATQSAIWALAAAGFAYQRILGRGHLPFLFQLPLAPLSILEASLRSVALSLRATTTAH